MHVAYEAHVANPKPIAYDNILLKHLYISAVFMEKEKITLLNVSRLVSQDPLQNIRRPTCLVGHIFSIFESKNYA